MADDALEYLARIRDFLDGHDIVGLPLLGTCTSEGSGKDKNGEYHFITIKAYYREGG